MTKLLITTGIFHPESGGPATYLYHLLPHLQANGFDVQVLTYGDPSPDDAATYPYPVTRIPRVTMPLRIANYYSAATQLMKWADMIYSHSALLPLPPTRKPRVIKIVGDQAWERAVNRKWIAQSTDIDHFQVRRTHHPMVRYLKRARRRAVVKARGVIVPSEYLKRMVNNWGASASRIQVIYNALPQTHTSPLTRTQARETLGLDAQRPMVLCVARLTPWKGVDDFIVAMRDVPDMQLIVAGDGEFRGPLEQFAVDMGVAERVRFLGRVPREQVAQYMKAADYVGLYSGYEGLSHVLLESLSAGTPIIASKKGGNPEVVQHNVNGLLVKWDDVDALSLALQTAFSPGKRDELAANSHIGIERFAYDRMVTNTATVLKYFYETYR
ncbi:MAG: glycosyltransferase family 4 protein [Chloroflexota bacterium]